MKTITIKLPEDEAKELEELIKNKGVSKPEFLRHLIIERLERNRKEKLSWLAIAERSMEKIWNNKEDEIWNKYL